MNKESYINQTCNYTPDIREKFVQMSIDEKRNYYKCADKFVMIEDIKKLKDQIKLIDTKTAVNSSELPLSIEEANLFADQISIWQGDITRLEIDAIVNAANERLNGGGGVDGAIHSAASKLLLAECKTLNGCKTGQAKITSGYHLPSKYVIHTVGPVGENPKMLKSSYESSLNLMKSQKLSSIAFPCISTGIFGYPNEPAARIAIQTAFEFLRSDYGKHVNRIIFTLFLEKDVIIYKRMLKAYFEFLK